MTQATEPKRKPDLIYKTTLKKTYGLPDSWIKQLGDPDKVIPNPHHRATKSYLYLRARVEVFIDDHQAEYDAMLMKRAERSARGKRVASRRAHELAVWARLVEIQIEDLPSLRCMEEQAAADFVAFHAFERNDFDAQFIPSRRAIESHVRHARTNYEGLLQELEGKPGCHEAYLIVRSRVDEAVRVAVDALTGS